MLAFPPEIMALYEVILVLLIEMLLFQIGILALQVEMFVLQLVTWAL
jgi:hypothetical protein